MKKIKGCLQDDCIAKKKKIVYRLDDNFCSKCGKSLYTICKKCKKTVIEEDAPSALCIRCQAEVDDKRQKRKETGEAVVGVAVSIGGVAGMAAKSVLRKK